MLLLSWNKSKEETKRKKETKARNQKKAKKKDKKEGRKERKRERQRKKKWKRGRPKKAMEKERETLKNQQKCPFYGEKQCFSIKNKERKGTPKKQEKTKKTNTEGLGPSEVALGATSPDPWTLQKNQKQKKQKQNKQKKNIKQQKKREKTSRKTNKYSKMSFSVITQTFFFLGGCPKFPFFDNLAQKARTLKTL